MCYSILDLQYHASMSICIKNYKFSWVWRDGKIVQTCFRLPCCQKYKISCEQQGSFLLHEIFLKKSQTQILNIVKLTNSVLHWINIITASTSSNESKLYNIAILLYFWDRHFDHQTTNQLFLKGKVQMLKDVQFYNSCLPKLLDKRAEKDFKWFGNRLSLGFLIQLSL